MNFNLTPRKSLFLVAHGTRRPFMNINLRRFTVKSVMVIAVAIALAATSSAEVGVVTQLVSINRFGTGSGNGGSAGRPFGPAGAISADGRFVAFESFAS